MAEFQPDPRKRTGSKGSRVRAAQVATGVAQALAEYAQVVANAAKPQEVVETLVEKGWMHLPAQEPYAGESAVFAMPYGKNEYRVTAMWWRDELWLDFRDAY